MRWTPARPAANHAGVRSRGGGAGRRWTVVGVALTAAVLLYVVAVAPHGEWSATAPYRPPPPAVVAQQPMAPLVAEGTQAEPQAEEHSGVRPACTTPKPRRYAHAVDAWMQHYLRIPSSHYSPVAIQGRVDGGGPATPTSTMSVAASLFGTNGGHVLDALAQRFAAAAAAPVAPDVRRQHDATFGFAVVDGSSGGDVCVEDAAVPFLNGVRFVIGFLPGVGTDMGQRYHEKCHAYNHHRRNTEPFTNDVEVDALVRSTFGPDWFEATVVVSDHPQPSAAATTKQRTSAINGDGFLQPLLFAYDAQRCLYVSTEAVRLPTSTRWSMVCLVDHLHDHWNAFRETQEEGHYDYVLQRVAPISPSVRRGAVPSWNSDHSVWMLQPLVHQATACSQGAAPPTPASDGLEVAERWVSVGEDPVQQYHTSELKGYWLSYKTMQWQDYKRVPNYQYDYLGRMHFGKAFQRRAEAMVGEVGAGRSTNRVAPPPCGNNITSRGAASAVDAPPFSLSSEHNDVPPSSYTDRHTILRLLRNRVIYFFGDSHMRIFFYGFLSRLGIAYPLDKVWRGDRTDYVRSENVTVHFIASYFLNFSRPSAEAMMMDPSHPIVVAGVGQHHSCHCWTVGKHMSVVREALRDLTLVDLSVFPPWSRADHISSAVPARWRHPRHVVWFGVPAQPYNTHLYRKKPVGQSRRDCRNNARHLLYSAFHHEAVAAASAAMAGNRGGAVSMVDAFQSSLGMQHTSLDGAHYYTWVREAWIEQLVDALRAGAGRNKD